LDCELNLTLSDYTGPFTFYYIERQLPPPIFDWNLYHELPHQPSGVGSGTSTFDDQDRDDEELTGESSYGVFGS